jgi:hypothetical protein
MQEWQITVWLSALLVVMFAAGCGYGYTFSRNKSRKVAHARKR